MFEVITDDKGVRAGILATAHGKVETPLFLTVATKAAVKHISVPELEQMGAQGIIANSYLLSQKPGIEIIRKAKGIHSFMGFSGCIFTDCGGFQAIRDEMFVKVVNDGIMLKSPFDGKKHLLNPETVMGWHNTIGSDVAMVLDDMPLHDATKERVAESVKRSYTWAQECVKHHDNDKQMLFGIAQGGTYPELRKKSIEMTRKLDVDGIALGGLAVGEEKGKMHKMIEIGAKLMPREKPRYVMGLGSPEDIVRAVSQGMDIFDSVYPTRNARHGMLFTHKGELRITHAKYAKDFKAVDSECECFVCRNHTRAYLHHLFKSNEPLHYNLSTYHNLFFMQQLMREIRTAIVGRRFVRYARDFLKGYKV